MENNLKDQKKEGAVEETQEQTSLDKAKANLKEALSWLLMLVIVIVVSYFITNHLILKAEIPTGSMKNTIMEHDRVIGWRQFKTIERGDIVIFPALEYAGEDCLYVKRVIGLPGETLEIHDGAVYINGNVLKETYLPEEMNNEFGPYKVPEGCYFLLGDNRNFSGDARYWAKNKYVSEDDILAKVIFKYSPSWEWMKKPEY
jgi:signal peptidase I